MGKQLLGTGSSWGLEESVLVWKAQTHVLAHGGF